MRFPAALKAAVSVCAFLGALGPSVSGADELDLSFNADAFRFHYAHDFKNNDLRWDAGILNNSDEGYIITSSLLLTGFASGGNNPLEAGLGGRIAIVDGDDSGQTGFPIAIGGYLKYTLPAMNRLSFRTDLYFAPDVLSFGDLERYEDYSINVAYNLLKEADVYLGARYVNGKFDDSRALFDNGIIGGVNIRF